MDHDIKLEKALEQLEKIVEELESGELGIEEALKRYEEGVKLSRLCTKKLTETEKKIEILNRALNQSGDIDFEVEKSGSDAKKSERKKAKKAGRNTEADPVGELLL